jgi:hypothetical protein
MLNSFEFDQFIGKVAAFMTCILGPFILLRSKLAHQGYKVPLYLFGMGWRANAQDLFPLRPGQWTRKHTRTRGFYLGWGRPEANSFMYRMSDRYWFDCWIKRDLQQRRRSCQDSREERSSLRTSLSAKLSLLFLLFHLVDLPSPEAMVLLL